CVEVKALAEISIDNAINQVMVILFNIVLSFLDSIFLECKGDLSGDAVYAFDLSTISSVVLNLERRKIIEIISNPGGRAVAPADVVIDRLVIRGVEIFVPEVRSYLAKPMRYLRVTTGGVERRPVSIYRMPDHDRFIQELKLGRLIYHVTCHYCFADLWQAIGSQMIAVD